MNGSKISFDDTAVAFGDKSDKALRLMYFLFCTMNYPLITKVGIWCTSTVLKLKLPVKGLIRKTLFFQFCGGESLEGCRTTIEKLKQSNIKAILDYSVEGENTEEGFEANKLEMIRSLEYAATSENIPITVMKLTAFIDFDLLIKAQSGLSFTENEKNKYIRFEKRVEAICAKAVKHGKCLYIDAEESWIQKAIDNVVYAMMRKFNKDKAYIFNTYQLYKKSALNDLTNAHQELRSMNCHLGAKLVRGAYMEKERERAEEMGYDDPIQPNKMACDRDYNLALDYCIDHIDSISVCAGTHNEDSSMHLAELIDSKGVDRADSRVFFAQLYGMSDNISYNLAKEGFNVAKYVPYGSVEKVMPYLMRRAEENTAIAGQTSREFLLVKKELKRRKG
ncbi:proline dehydrogenase family protein [Reichenbachiella sp. MALMAid0571]|uniref:proline dehydrogenase family protein n=1 Tax=Reichenbachiella sp. MALMAid0571 TaxID=3143939 RepID=UPI0032DECC2A